MIYINAPYNKIDNSTTKSTWIDQIHTSIIKPDESWFTSGDIYERGGEWLN